VKKRDYVFVIASVLFVAAFVAFMVFSTALAIWRMTPYPTIEARNQCIRAGYDNAVQWVFSESVLCVMDVRYVPLSEVVGGQ